MGPAGQVSCTAGRGWGFVADLIPVHSPGGYSAAVRTGRVFSSGLATVPATITALAAAAVAVGDTVWERCR